MTDPLAEKIGVNVQGGTVNVQNLNIGITERLAESGDRVRILVVAANPLGSSPLKLDHEVKTIQEALRRSRKRDNFVVEYRLAATPSELRRALLDVEPHVLHFSGHGAGEQGLLFVSDESAGAISRSDSGEVRSRSTNTDEIKFVPAQPLANLLQLCEEHLECVVLNACYSDVQGDAISANIPFTIGMRDVVADNVAIKFSQGFYDAIGAGKGYESAFKWGKVAIEFDLADDEATKILVLRRNEKTTMTSPQSQDNQKLDLLRKLKGNGNSERGKQKGNIINLPKPNLPNLTYPSIFLIVIVVTSTIGLRLLDKTHNSTFQPIATSLKPTYTQKTAKDFLDEGYVKQEKKDKQGALSAYSEAIRLNPEYIRAYSRRGVLLQEELGEEEKAKFDFKKAISLEAKTADDYLGRGIAKLHLGDKNGAILDYTEAIRIQPDLAYAYNNRASVQQELGETQRAIDDYTEAIRLQPDFAGAYVGRGIANNALRNYNSSVIDFTKAIEFSPKEPNFYTFRGNAKYNLGKEKEAILDHTRAIEIDPNFAPAYFNRGIAKKTIRDNTGAIADFNQSILLKPDSGSSYFQRGLAKKEIGDNQAALVDLREAARLYQQQGNTEWYDNSRDRIKELGG